MRRIVFIIPALAGALGVAAPAFAQSDEVLGDDYPADDTAPPAEEYAGDDAAPAYDDTGSYDTGSYDDGSYGDPAANVDTDDAYAYDDYANRTVSPETFQRTLAPYGRWVRTPEYGLIWIPSRSVVGDNFVPYTTGGSWRYSNAGWTFATSWNWGWAPFHYGRWYRAPRWGWVWVPGYTWGPAWVDWRYGNGYVGWAPLPPRRFAASLRYHDYWFFCSVRDMWRPHVWRYRVRSTPHLFRVAVPARRPVRYHGRARWFAGPSPRAVERVIGRRVDRVQLRPTRHERVVRRVDRRQQAPRQRVERRIQQPERQRIQRPERQQAPRQQFQRPERQRVERQQMREQRQQQRVRETREQRQQQRVEQQQRVQRQQLQRPERQRVERQRPERQRVERQQMREQRQQQRAERQQQRQQAREQRQQPSRERRRRPDRDR